MDQVVQMTRNRSTGQIEDIKFFKEFYDSDLDMQLHHLKHLLEIAEVAPGTIKLIEHDGNEQDNRPSD